MAFQTALLMKYNIQIQNICDLTTKLNLLYNSTKNERSLLRVKHRNIFSIPWKLPSPFHECNKIFLGDHRYRNRKFVARKIACNHITGFYNVMLQYLFHTRCVTGVGKPALLPSNSVLIQLIRPIRSPGREDLQLKSSGQVPLLDNWGLDIVLAFEYDVTVVIYRNRQWCLFLIYNMD